MGREGQAGHHLCESHRQGSQLGQSSGWRATVPFWGPGRAEEGMGRVLGANKLVGPGRDTQCPGCKVSGCVQPCRPPPDCSLPSTPTMSYLAGGGSGPRWGPLTTSQDLRPRVWPGSEGAAVGLREAVTGDPPVIDACVFHGPGSRVGSSWGGRRDGESLRLDSCLLPL